MTSFLTLDEVQLCQEFEFFGDVQLEVSEGWVSIQSEMLEVLNGFAQPGATKNIEGSISRTMEEQCLQHDTFIHRGGRVRQIDEEGGMYDYLLKDKPGIIIRFSTTSVLFHFKFCLYDKNINIALTLKCFSNFLK